MKKKVLAAFLASVMVFAMTGCSGGNQASSEPVEVASIDDLADLTIGVQIGTTGDSAATDAVNEDSQVNRFNKGADAIQALKNGKVDCVVIDSLPAEKFVEANDDLEIVDGIFDTEEYAICMKKGNTELRDAFNEALAELKEDGTLEEIQSYPERFPALLFPYREKVRAGFDLLYKFIRTGSCGPECILLQPVEKFVVR